MGGGTLSVQFEDRAQTAHVARVRVRVETEAGTLVGPSTACRPRACCSPRFPAAPVETVRVSVVEATGDDADYGRVVVSELTLPGVEPGRTTVVPGPLDRDDSLALRLDPPRRACVDLGLGPHCVESQARPGQDNGRLDRTIEVAEAGEWEVSGTVVAVPGPGSAALLAPVDGSATARAGSVLAGDPAVSGGVRLRRQSRHPLAHGQRRRPGDAAAHLARPAGDPHPVDRPAGG